METQIAHTMFTELAIIAAISFLAGFAFVSMLIALFRR